MFSRIRWFPKPCRTSQCQSPSYRECLAAWRASTTSWRMCSSERTGSREYRWEHTHYILTRTDLNCWELSRAVNCVWSRAVNLDRLVKWLSLKRVHECPHARTHTHIYDLQRSKSSSAQNQLYSTAQAEGLWTFSYCIMYYHLHWYSLFCLSFKYVDTYWSLHAVW